MEEYWKDIEGFDGLYQVSNLGRVRALKRVVVFKDGRKRIFEEKVLKNMDRPDGYQTVCLWLNNVLAHRLVHRLVCEAFLENPEGKPFVDHINTDKKDNRVINLRWCTQKENAHNPITEKKHKEYSESLKGSHMTDEQKSKISAAVSGKNHPLFGTHCPEERKQKISEALTKMPVLQFTKEGEFVAEWASQKIASKTLHINNINACLKGKCPSAGGYIWKYKH